LTNPQPTSTVNNTLPLLETDRKDALTSGSSDQGICMPTLGANKSLNSSFEGASPITPILIEVSMKNRIGDEKQKESCNAEILVVRPPKMIQIQKMFPKKPMQQEELIN
jgi:hypothetical protein